MDINDGDQPLVLLDERKICSLVGAKGKELWKLEASGVVFHSGIFYVIFDNLYLVAKIRSDLHGGDIVNIEGGDRKKSEYEGITYDSSDRIFYIVVESKKDDKKDGYYAWVYEFDLDFKCVHKSQLDCEFSRGNKGFEGLAFLKRNGHSYLLALCEGNECIEKKEVAELPGGGRIQVFEKAQDRWTRYKTLKLPESIPFKDYSGLDVRNQRIVVVSQKTSKLWVCHLHSDEWRLAEGRTYDFPRNKKGKKCYCNVEGVSWITSQEIVVVSDKAKDSKKDRCKKKDQSIHIFQIPDSS